MKNPIIYFLLTLFPFAGTAQYNPDSPYQLRAKQEIAIGLAGMGTAGTAFVLNQNLDPLTEAEILDLQAEGISSFESWATGQRSAQSGHASDYLLYSSQAFPVILTLLDKPVRQDFLKVGTMYSEALLINGGLTALVKNVVLRPRPYVYDASQPLEFQQRLSARTSFWSGHTSQTATMCFLTARLYADYHPESRWRPVVWTAAAAVPAATGLLRMTAGRHFPTDVLTGYLTGAAIGYFLPRLHRKKAKKEAPKF